MLYSIIPPVLVVLSAIGIIIFIMKKSSAVADLEKDELARERNFSNGINRGAMANVAVSVGASVSKNNFKNIFLLVFEKVIRSLSVMFFKLENKFVLWRESVKNKRNERQSDRRSDLGANLYSGEDTSSEESVMEKLSHYPMPEKKEQDRNQFLKNKEEDSKIFRPMVSDRVVVPRRKKIETKESFENILIDRIAANPRDTEAYERLGEYYLEIENYEHAKECFKQVVKLDPTNRSVKYKIRKLERILG